MDFEEYARRQPLTAESYAEEPTQIARIEKLLDRCVGSVLDVGGGDGYIARLLMDRGHDVTMLEASETRLARAEELGVNAILVGPTFAEWPLEAIGDDQWDTVLLGEVLEHLDNPGRMLRDAFATARERVIITVPLLGWPDPTHQWRISLDHLATPDDRPDRPDSSEQIILTWQRGTCWPIEWWRNDPGWKAQFENGH